MVLAACKVESYFLSSLLTLSVSSIAEFVAEANCLYSLCSYCCYVRAHWTPDEVEGSASAGFPKTSGEQLAHLLVANGVLEVDVALVMAGAFVGCGKLDHCRSA